MDFVRAISILMVVFGHTSLFFLRAQNVPFVGKISPAFTEGIMNFGIVGVELFFVLSGFLIGGILIRIFMQPGDFSFAAIKNFWTRRWFRTLPNYWLLLTVCLVVNHLVDFDRFQWHYLKGYFFLQNFFSPNSLGGYPEGWSLSIEEWFYLSLPLVMYFSVRLLPGANRERLLLKIFTGYLAVFFLLRLVNAFNPINGVDPDEGIRKVVIFRLDSVMYGVVLAYVKYFRGAFFIKWRRYFLAISLAGSSGILLLLFKYNFALRSNGDPVIRFLSNAFLYFMLPLMLSLCLPYAAGVSEIKNKRSTTIIRHLSKISYSMYLTHYSLVYLLFFHPIKVNSIGSVSLLYILYWFTVTTLSSLIYKYFEYPVMNLRDRPAFNRRANGVSKKEPAGIVPD